MLKRVRPLCSNSNLPREWDHLIFPGSFGWIGSQGAHRNTTSSIYCIFVHMLKRVGPLCSSSNSPREWEPLSFPGSFGWIGKKTWRARAQQSKPNRRARALKQARQAAAGHCWESAVLAVPTALSVSQLVQHCWLSKHHNFSKWFSSQPKKLVKWPCEVFLWTFFGDDETHPQPWYV